jgi:radical SAM-linked protein
MERFAGEKTAVSFPSMRVGTLTPELMHLIRKVRKTGFTLAPEAGSERLRRVINKGILDRDLLDAANNAFRLGWNVLKLYFMIGLPTETAEDLDAMAALCMEVWKLARASRSAINVSVSTFVPKPLTPFQWVGQIEPLDVQKGLDYVRDRLNRPGIRFKWNQPEHSLLEAVFARGDRRLSRTLKRAWELGVRFDGWTERFRNDLWIQAFSDTGLDPSFYAQRQRMPDEILPWDHLSAGVQRDFLWQEYQRACSEEFTPDCRWDRCSVCGVCDHNQVKPHLFTEKVTFPPHKETVPATRQEHFMYWLQYSKLGRIRFFGQLEIAQSFARAIRRAKLPAAYSEGFHPHVKLSFVEALPLGFESRVEEMYLTLTEEFDPEKVKVELNRHLPEGLHIEEVNHVLRRLARPQPLKVTYRISDLKPGSVNHVLHSWSGHLKEELTKKTKRGVVKVELGDVLCDVRQISESTVELDIREGVQTCFRPIAVLKHILGEEQEDLSECLVCKVASG